MELHGLPGWLPCCTAQLGLNESFVATFARRLHEAALPPAPAPAAPPLTKHLSSDLVRRRARVAAASAAAAMWHDAAAAAAASSAQWFIHAQ